jgi:hypothetical protein
VTWDRDQDPVVAMGMGDGELVGTLPCPYMIQERYKRPRACGEQAFLFRYPVPFGLRSRCEDGHEVPLPPTAIPGLLRPMKRATD